MKGTVLMRYSTRMASSSTVGDPGLGRRAEPSVMDGCWNNIVITTQCVTDIFSHPDDDSVYEVDVAVGASDVGLHHPGQDAVPGDHGHVAPLHPPDDQVPAPDHPHPPPHGELGHGEGLPRHQVPLQGVLGQVARLRPQAGVQARLLPPQQRPGGLSRDKVGEVCLSLTQPRIEILLFTQVICCPIS